MSKIELNEMIITEKPKDVKHFSKNDELRKEQAMELIGSN